MGRHRKPDSESAGSNAVPQTGTPLLPHKSAAATPISYGARTLGSPPRLDMRRPAVDLTRTGHSAAPPLRDINRVTPATDRPTFAGDRPFGHPEQHRTRTQVGHRQPPMEVREPRETAGRQHRLDPDAGVEERPTGNSGAGSLVRRSRVSGKQVDLFQSRTGETTIDVIDASAVNVSSAVAVLDRPRRDVSADDDEELVRLWTFFVGQAAVAAILGLLLWLASYWEWRHSPYLAAITSPIVLIGMLFGAQQICLRRQPSQGLDLFTTGVVLGVGVFLTVLPAAFVLRPI